MNVAESSYVGRDFQNADTVNVNSHNTNLHNNYNFHDSDNLNNGFHGVVDMPNLPDDVRSEKSYSSKSSKSSRSSYRSNKSAESYASKRSSSKKEKETDEFVDYNLIWAFGIISLLLTGFYVYWVTSLQCAVTENDETNLTMQYALDRFLNNKDQEGMDDLENIESLKKTVTELQE